jgi:hypothetical protein
MAQVVQRGTGRPHANSIASPATPTPNGPTITVVRPKACTGDLVRYDKGLTKKKGPEGPGDLRPPPPPLWP